MELAQMAGEVTAVAAVEALDRGDDVVFAAAAVEVVARLAHQVPGAIGFTQEHRLHHLTRRLWSWRDEGGRRAALVPRARRRAAGRHARQPPARAHPRDLTGNLPPRRSSAGPTGRPAGAGRPAATVGQERDLRASRARSSMAANGPAT